MSPQSQPEPDNKNSLALTPSELIKKHATISNHIISDEEMWNLKIFGLAEINHGNSKTRLRLPEVSRRNFIK